jgi:hypothetical protein
VSGPVIRFAEEAGKSRTFGWVLDWPGWCRATREPGGVPAELVLAAPRYARAAAIAGLALEADPAALTPADFELIERVAGSASTDFGVPGSVTADDRRPLGAAGADRLARIVGAAWTVLDQVVAGAPAELRKGPRGGGRDRDKVMAHCVSADAGYAREIGLRLPEPNPTDRPAVDAERRAILALLRRPSDGSPLADRRWPPRYAARRIAWHALDHAWEIEDRS